MNQIQELINKKNEWLYSQVDVEFPTSDSLKGRALYQRKAEDCEYKELSPPVTLSDSVPDIYKVDFHRLTVMFAQLQSSQYCGEQSAQILEFFAQIIISEQHDIYLGFVDQKLAFGALVTSEHHLVLVSDIVVMKEYSDLNNEQVASQLTHFLDLDYDKVNVWLNVLEK